MKMEIGRNLLKLKKPIYLTFNYYKCRLDYFDFIAKKMTLISFILGYHPFQRLLIGKKFNHTSY